MKAIRLKSFGGAEALAVEDVPMPELRSGDILIRVRASGVNPAATPWAAA